MGAKQQPRVPAVSPCSCKNCTRMGSNRSPSVRLFCRASFRVSAAGVPPNFTGFLHLPSINFALRRRRKRELAGGTLNSHFQPPKSRHAQRGYPMLAPAEPTKKSDARSRIPLSLVPDSLAPRPSLPRSSFLAPPLQRTDFSRHGSHRCCGEAGGGRRFQRTGSVVAYWGHQRLH